MGERWSDIHGSGNSRASGSIPMGGQHSTPVVRTPICPDHCSGKHALDSVILCPHCQAAAFQVWSHEYLWTEGHNFHELLPVNGAALDGPRVRCTCGREFRRT